MLQIIVLLLTAALLGTAIWGVTNLRQEFNPIWFIPKSTYLFQFLIRMFDYYPNLGKNNYLLNIRDNFTGK